MKKRKNEYERLFNKFTANNVLLTIIQFKFAFVLGPI